MKTEDIVFGESNAKLYGKLWMPEGNPCAVLQISHGMTEHIGRYEKMAETLANRGIAVAGYDLRGMDTVAVIRNAHLLEMADGKPGFGICIFFIRN